MKQRTIGHAPPLPSLSDEKERREYARTTQVAAHLAELSRSTDPEVLSEVVINEFTSEETLLSLMSETRHEVVRMALTKRKRLSEVVVVDAVKERINSSHTSRMRTELARRRECPPDLLRELAKDESKFVRLAVLRNPRVPQDVISALSDDQNLTVRRALAKMDILTTDVATKLSHDEDEDVRTNVMMGGLLPGARMGELVEELDPDYFVLSFCGRRWAICHLGIADDNSEALSQIVNLPQWWTLTPESDEVVVALILSGNRER